jgi:hypothetical protein
VFAEDGRQPLHIGAQIVLLHYALAAALADLLAQLGIVDEPRQ